MRLVVEEGTGGRADAPGYLVGGKTGTAEKVGWRISSPGVAVFLHRCLSDRRASLHCFALLDEPKGTKKTHGYATGGWVAAPVVGRVVQKIGPIAGIRPYDPELPPIRRDVAINRTPGTRTLASY